MHRRTFLQLGVGSAAVLALAGGAVAVLQPGLRQGALSPRARVVIARVALAILADAWTPGEAAMRALLERINDKIAGTPHAVQSELSQLLALMDTAPGRRALVGIRSSWEEVQADELRLALQSMRVSDISLRQQAYQGLHDLVYAAYFSGRESWSLLGYPGPVEI